MYKKNVRIDAKLNLVTEEKFLHSGEDKSLQALELLKSELYTGTCDLHLFTVASHGTDSVGEIMEKVLKYGLHAFAITDNDTMEGVESMCYIVEKLLKLGIDVPHFIRGIQLTLSYQQHNVALLAYFPIGYGKELLQFLERQRRQREQRNLEICQKLNQAGFPISYKEVKDSSSYIVGRTHFAKVLSRHGYAATSEEAYQHWLAKDKIAYVPFDVPSIEEGIQVVRNAGGVPVLAFKSIVPWLSEGYEYLCEQFAYLKEKGLLGVQPVHGHASEYEIKFILSAAKEIGLDLFSGSGYKGYHDLSIDMFRKEMDFSKFIS